jgi:V/A-type H+-transporting ATPase subunit E
MDAQLAKLIEKIKTEGVEEGRLASQKIVQEAAAEAARIVEKAKQEAAGMLEDAREKSHTFQKSGELAVRQAARDAVLQLKGQIHALFDRVFKREISETLAPETVRDMVMKITDQWAKNTGIEISLNEKEKGQLENLLFAGLRKEMKNTVTLGGSRGIEHGFRIGLKGESVRYDFTDEGITQILLQFLKPRLKEIVEKENG